MTVCHPALPTKPLPRCLLNLEIGTIADANTNVNVYIHDITTGRPEMFQTTSDANGLVSIDASGYEFSDSHSYELWITLQSAGIEDKENITLQYQTVDTLALTFVNIQSAGNCVPMDAVIEEA